MTTVDCIVTQGDYISIHKSENVLGEVAANISILDSRSADKISTVVVNRYSAEQIIQALKDEFDL